MAFDVVHGSAGMTLLGSDNDDSTVILPDMGFDFYYNGINCRTTINLSGNSWVGFGSATENLCVNRRDAKYQNAYTSMETIRGIQAFRIRYEGSYNYTPVTNDLWWEVILFADSTMELIIERFPTGTLGLNTLETMGNGVYTKVGGWVAGESYVFTPTAALGTFYNVATGIYPPVVEPTSAISFNIDNSLKAYSIGWVNIDNSLKAIDSMWVAIDNLLYKSYSATPVAPIIYGVKIDTLNTNPATALTYTDNAVGFTPALGNNGLFNYGSWADKFPFNAIKPCLLLNGVVNYYLNPLDFTKKADGSASDITTGIDGDVMIEFPKVYWKFETIGTDVYIRYSSVKIDAGYKCLGHTKGIIEKDKCYIAAYLGYTLSSKHRSLSGYLPTATQNLTGFRTSSHLTGVGIEVLSYFQYLMLQVLFIVMFKNRNSQSALGLGYTLGNASSIITGGTNTKGMFYGSTSNLLQNKFCGIEDIFGNLMWILDGLFFDVNRNILIGTENYNDTGVGYTNYGPYGTANVSVWLGTIQGGTETGFIYKGSTGASGTTHYCDTTFLATLSIPFVGGSYDQTADYNGIFGMNAQNGADAGAAFIGARIGFL